MADGSRRKFKAHELAAVLRDDPAGEVTSAIAEDYMVKGSAGQGSWAVGHCSRRRMPTPLQPRWSGVELLIG